MLESPNLDRFLDTVMSRVACKKHRGGQIGLPCFVIGKLNGFGYNGAVCNKRAVAAGFVGKIMPESLSARRRTTNGKRS